MRCLRRPARPDRGLADRGHQAFWRRWPHREDCGLAFSDELGFGAGGRSEDFIFAGWVLGYLRRSPTDAPDFSDAGYKFCLNKLNLFNGNFIDAEMVKTFISSIEYRQRFGP